MANIHFLNVLEGDCNIIQHDSDRITVIDVSNADNGIDTEAEKAKKTSLARQAMFSMSVPSGKTNYGRKKYPDNPIAYLKGLLNGASIFRFIITHPDMDHLDGVADLFGAYEILNIWDTDNNKEIADFRGGGYSKEDWEFYLKIRSGKEGNRKTYLANDSYEYFNEDQIKILAPTKALVDMANQTGNYNDSSFVILYTPPKSNNRQWKILFAGDSHDQTWEYILKNHKADVTNVDVLFAPHHGRNSNMNFDFLKTVNPKVTLFGNADSQHLAYDKYPEVRITNNQAGFVVIEAKLQGLYLYVQNQEFANDFCNKPKRRWGDAAYHSGFQAYNIGQIAAD